jgi:hypothetical protein
MGDHAALSEQQKRRVAKHSADQTAGENVAEEMHAKNNSRRRDAQSREKKEAEKVRIIQPDGNCNRKGCDGMPGWERELVRRQDRGPAMGFKGARSLSTAQPLDGPKQDYAYARCCGSRT